MKALVKCVHLREIKAKPKKNDFILSEQLNVCEGRRTRWRTHSQQARRPVQMTWFCCFCCTQPRTTTAVCCLLFAWGAYRPCSGHAGKRYGQDLFEKIKILKIIAMRLF